MLNALPIYYFNLLINLQSNGGAQLIRGILQLLEEWEYHFSLGGVAHQSMKAIRARNVDGPSRDANGDGNDYWDKQHEQVSDNRWAWCLLPGLKSVFWVLGFSVVRSCWRRL